MEHTILDNEDFNRHIDYLQINPFKRVLVKLVADGLVLRFILSKTWGITFESGIAGRVGLGLGRTVL